MRILKEPPPEVVAELQRLRGTQLLAYLESSLDTVKDALVGCPDTDQIRVLQGQAQTLQHLIHHVEPGKR